MTDNPGFHAHDDGWYFRREDDGSVRILAPDSQGHQAVLLDASTWASIVASVSALRETGATFRVAEAFHAGAELAVAEKGPTVTYPTCPTCCTHDH